MFNSKTSEISSSEEVTKFQTSYPKNSGFSKLQKLLGGLAAFATISSFNVESINAKTNTQISPNSNLIEQLVSKSDGRLNPEKAAEVIKVSKISKVSEVKNEIESLRSANALDSQPAFDKYVGKSFKQDKAKENIQPKTMLNQSEATERVSTGQESINTEFYVNGIFNPNNEIVIRFAKKHGIFQPKNDPAYVNFLQVIINSYTNGANTTNALETYLDQRDKVLNPKVSSNSENNSVNMYFGESKNTSVIKEHVSNASGVDKPKVQPSKTNFGTIESITNMPEIIVNDRFNPNHPLVIKYAKLNKIFKANPTEVDINVLQMMINAETNGTNSNASLVNYFKQREILLTSNKKISNNLFELPIGLAAGAFLIVSGAVGIKKIRENLELNKGSDDRRVNYLKKTPTPNLKIKEPKSGADLNQGDMDNSYEFSSRFDSNEINIQSKDFLKQKQEDKNSLDQLEEYNKEISSYSLEELKSHGLNLLNSLEIDLKSNVFQEDKLSSKEVLSGRARTTDSPKHTLLFEKESFALEMLSIYESKYKKFIYSKVIKGELDYVGLQIELAKNIINSDKTNERFATIEFDVLNVEISKVALTNNLKKLPSQSAQDLLIAMKKVAPEAHAIIQSQETKLYHAIRKEALMKAAKTNADKKNIANALTSIKSKYPAEFKDLIKTA